MAQSDHRLTVHQICCRVVRRTDKDHFRVVINPGHDAIRIKGEPLAKRHLSGLDPLQHGGLRIHGEGWRADDDVVLRRNTERPHQTVDGLVRAARDGQVARRDVKPATDGIDELRRLLHRIARQSGRADERLIRAFIGVEKHSAFTSRNKRARRHIALHCQDFRTRTGCHGVFCLDVIHRLALSPASFQSAPPESMWHRAPSDPPWSARTPLPRRRHEPQPYRHAPATASPSVIASREEWL